jgi:hypothetical protein
MQKRNLLIAFMGLSMLLIAPGLFAQLRADSQARLAFSSTDFSEDYSEWDGLGMQDHEMADMFKKKRKKRKKRRKKNTLAIGLVAGGPVGFGGRVVFRPSRLAVAGDIAYSRIRTDNGPLIGAMTAKIDARFYSKGIIARLLRPYIFAGATMQRGQFNEVSPESVFYMDAGVGGGIKLWRLEINAEVGMLIPALAVEAYQPRLGVFGNVGVLIWLI